MPSKISRALSPASRGQREAELEMLASDPSLEQFGSHISSASRGKYTTELDKWKQFVARRRAGQYGRGIPMDIEINKPLTSFAPLRVFLAFLIALRASGDTHRHISTTFSRVLSELRFCGFLPVMPYATEILEELKAESELANTRAGKGDEELVMLTRCLFPTITEEFTFALFFSDLGLRQVSLSFCTIDQQYQAIETTVLKDKVLDKESRKVITRCGCINPDTWAPLDPELGWLLNHAKHAPGNLFGWPQLTQAMQDKVRLDPSYFCLVHNRYHHANIQLLTTKLDSQTTMVKIFNKTARTIATRTSKVFRQTLAAFTLQCEQRFPGSQCAFCVVERQGWDQVQRIRGYGRSYIYEDCIPLYGSLARCCPHVNGGTSCLLRYCLPTSSTRRNRPKRKPKKPSQTFRGTTAARRLMKKLYKGRKSSEDASSEASSGGDTSD